MWYGMLFQFHLKMGEFLWRSRDVKKAPSQGQAEEKCRVWTKRAATAIIPM